ncbi:MAG: hypothetical protein AB8B79_15650 [Granulosicoccus sp.]
MRPSNTLPNNSLAKVKAASTAVQSAVGQGVAKGVQSATAALEQPSWAERFAQEKNTTQNLLATVSPLDQLQANRPVVDPSNANRVLQSGHPLAIPRPTSIDVAVSAQTDGAELADEGEQTPEQRAEALSDQGYTDEEVTQILADINTLREGSQADRIQAVFSLAQNLQPDEIGDLAEELGIEDQAIVKFLTDTKAIEAVATLVNADSSATDKISAAITLVESAGDLASGSLEAALKGPLASISAGQELITLIETFRNPDASALEKTEAILAFAVAAKDSLGTLAPNLARELRRLDSLGNSVAAALTIFDSSASKTDRLEAVADLFANVPDVKDDVGKLSQRLIDQILGNYADIAFELPEAVLDSIGPALGNALSPEDISRINKLNAELAVEGADNIVAKLLSNVESPDSIAGLLDALDSQSDTATRKALVETLGELKPGRLDELLASSVGGRNGAALLGDTLVRLDPDDQAALRKLIKEFDADSIEFLLRISSKVDAGVLGEFLSVASKLPANRVGQVLGLIDTVLSKAGVEITSDVAAKLLRNAAKLIPAAGIIPAIYDAGRLGSIAADSSLPPDIRFLAGLGVKINAGDAAVSVIEAFTAWTGVSVVVDVGIGITALITDLIVGDQLDKFQQAQAAGEEYTAPAWLTTANVTLAAAQGPSGWVEYWAIYGADDGIAALGIAIESGGTAAIHGAEGLLTLGAEGIGEGLELTADGLHLLADIIRNPDVYGDKAVEFGRQAVEQLNELAEGVGDLAEAAAEELADVVSDLKQLGEDGIEALGWIASNPGQAAELAVEAIGNIASDALELGNTAARAVAREALEKLDELADLSEALAEHVEAVVSDVANRAIELGEQGIEALGWIASNPGQAADIAQRALVDVAVQGGELAEAAYAEIVDLGEAGVELAKEVANELIELGEDGIEMLAFIVTHPGEAADLAVEGLRDIASGIGDAAERAGEELIDLAENGYDTAKDAVQTLLLEGGEAFRNVVTALGDNIGPGLKSVLNGLADVGQAGRDALKGLADAGLDFAQDGLESAADAISDLGEWAWNKTGGRILDWFR